MTKILKKVILFSLWYHNPTLNVYFELLLEAGGDVNQADNDNYTALGKSSQNGRLEIVCRLLQQPNIDVNKGAEGRSPLALAKNANHNEIVQLLKDASAE